jgi:hypothetical protein
MKKLLLVAALASTCIAGQASAGQVITSDNGYVRIGVNDDGSLNLGSVGLGYNFTGQSGRVGFQDALSPGCLCESWGAAGNGLGGQVGQSTGNQNIAVGASSFAGGTFTSNTSLSNVPGLTVTQAYALSNQTATGALFMNTVTLTNTTGATITDLRYARAMDWDVPPSEFDEFTTFVGTGTTPTLLRSTDDGFANANPMTADANGGIIGPIDADGVTGPEDHGSLFVFGFGDLLAGASYSFNIFYGAGANESDALSLLSQVGPQLYTLGQSSTGSTRRTDLPTFVFAFNGVGGEVVVPPPGGAVPEPATWAMMLMGFFGLGSVLRRRKLAAVAA